jgi:hypothetical protein
MGLAMREERVGGVRSALAWLALPAVPVVLDDFYHHTINVSYDGQGGPDPRDWDWFRWVTLLGPLAGYAFLAGATAGVPDDPARRGWRGWSSRRSVWVAVGPWSGFLVGFALFWILAGLVEVVPPAGRWINSILSFLQGTWTGWVLEALLVVMLGYAWLLPACAAVRRAGRAGGRWRAFKRGLVSAVAFLGSLFGSFWAVTEAWRGFFFDTRVVPVLLAAAGLVVLSGCGGPVTYGEVRRRELFDAMLMAWLLGLALLWRWWGRPRSKPPGPGS